VAGSTSIIDAVPIGALVSLKALDLTARSVSLSLCLSVSLPLPVCLSVCLSSVCLSVCQSVGLPACMPCLRIPCYINSFLEFVVCEQRDREPYTVAAAGSCHPRQRPLRGSTLIKHNRDSAREREREGGRERERARARVREREAGLRRRVGGGVQRRTFMSMLTFPRMSRTPLKSLKEGVPFRLDTHKEGCSLCLQLL
jgi:hypothetical protein